MQESDQKPWWRRMDGVPPAIDRPPKGRLDRWAIEKPVAAALIAAIVVGLASVLLANGSPTPRVLTGLGFVIVFGVIQWAVLDLRRRRLSSRPSE